VISVDELVAVPSLGLTFIAGRSGGSRRVIWAHACDLPDPWNWVNPGDLVMTTGGGLSAEAGEQQRWIEQIIEHRVSAVVVALRPDAPELDPKLLAAAEQANLPVLRADFDLHFVTLARTVIESVVETERMRVTRIRRLYDVYWQSLHSRGSLIDRLSALEMAAGWRLMVDDQLGRAVAAGRHATEAGRPNPKASIRTSIPGALGYTLIAAADEAIDDSALLQHVSGLVALELEHQTDRKDALREVGADLLTGLLDETLTLTGAWPQFRHRGMHEPLALVCWSADSGAELDHSGVHLAPAWGRCAPLLVAEDAMVFGLMPAQADLLDQITLALGDGCRCGVSPTLTVNSSAPEAARQARMAAASAHDIRQRVVRYGAHRDGSEVLFPRTVDDSRALVSAVLGPLSAHDRSTGGDLVATLHTFLEQDGSSGRTAARLQIHRQTLVYRLRKIEQLTGHKPSSTAGASRFWLAFEVAGRARFDLGALT
jgi:purine catabolism regulator